MSASSIFFANTSAWPRTPQAAPTINAITTAIIAKIKTKIKTVIIIPLFLIVLLLFKQRINHHVQYCGHADHNKNRNPYRPQEEHGQTDGDPAAARPLADIADKRDVIHVLNTHKYQHPEKEREAGV